VAEDKIEDQYELLQKLDSRFNKFWDDWDLKLAKALVKEVDERETLEAVVLGVPSIHSGVEAVRSRLVLDYIEIKITSLNLSSTRPTLGRRTDQQTAQAEKFAMECDGGTKYQAKN